MTVKIVRVANGEDIIADVQEAYPNKEVYAPIGYFLTNPYQVIVEATAEMLFEEGTTDEPQKINDLNMQLFPWTYVSRQTLSSSVESGSNNLQSTPRDSKQMGKINRGR